MNLGYEDDELKPYVEPELDFKELKRIGECICYIVHIFLNTDVI